MKKIILTIIISSIFIITLLAAPLSLNADEAKGTYVVNVHVPHAGLSFNWTHPEGRNINLVIVSPINYVTGPSWVGNVPFPQDGDLWGISVNGVGTPNVTVNSIPGGMDEWYFRITFVSDSQAGDMGLTCYQVWINEDNNFEFVFWYLHKDNNWVRIYDMEDNMVFEEDLSDPNLIVDLPDGMYVVKTYHTGDEPIQEFLIGKPGPEM
jgi:hypothetical protein